MPCLPLFQTLTSETLFKKKIHSLAGLATEQHVVNVSPLAWRSWKLMKSMQSALLQRVNISNTSTWTATTSIVCDALTLEFQMFNAFRCIWPVHQRAMSKSDVSLNFSAGRWECALVNTHRLYLPWGYDPSILLNKPLLDIMEIKV